MKTRGKIWIIYDAETKKQTKPMSVVQAQVTLLSLSSKKSSRYFIWTPGWDEWVCVRKFLASDQEYFAAQRPPEPQLEDSEAEKTKAGTVTANNLELESDSPYTKVALDEEPIKPKEVGGFYDEEFLADELDLSKVRKVKNIPVQHKSNSSKSTSKSEQRCYPRFDLKIEVVLVSKVRSFRTYSKNISLSGTLLEDDLPRDFLNKPFDLIIVNPFEKDPSKSRLLFRAKILGDLTHSRRLTFIEQDVQMTERLDSLLRAYLEHQDKIRKSAG
ncbi:MAG: PilZ domain-containing protein [Bdellovibrio sp.]|nr:PilZ domain-containing protein [Bdellovibrio sp.]